MTVKLSDKQRDALAIIARHGTIGVDALTENINAASSDRRSREGVVSTASSLVKHGYVRRGTGAYGLVLYAVTDEGVALVSSGEVQS